MDRNREGSDFQDLNHEDNMGRQLIARIEKLFQEIKEDGSESDTLILGKLKDRVEVYLQYLKRAAREEGFEERFKKQKYPVRTTIPVAGDKEPNGGWAFSFKGGLSGPYSAAELELYSESIKEQGGEVLNYSLSRAGFIRLLEGFGIKVKDTPEWGMKAEDFDFPKSHGDSKYETNIPGVKLELRTEKIDEGPYPGFGHVIRLELEKKVIRQLLEI